MQTVDVKKEVLERTNTPAFLALCNNSVINFKHFFSNVIEMGHGQTNKILNSLQKYSVAQTTELYRE
jgi:hypothetical protein